MRESVFQLHLLDRLYEMFPDCFVLKNDSSYMQGVPDLLILFRDRWAMLEVKISKAASHRPNQDYYVSLLDSMSFAAFIFPEKRGRGIRCSSTRIRI